MTDKAAVHTANVFLPGCLGPVKRDVVLEDDHLAAVAALQQQAEALRADYSEACDDAAAVARQLRRTEQELEGARGLLRKARRYVAQDYPDGVHSYRANSISGDLLGDIDAFLTATPAPEVQAEQGERQEAAETDALRKRFSEIEDEVARGKHSAMSCFTAMRTAALYN